MQPRVEDADAAQQNALRTFRSPDAIMEQSIIEGLRRYIAAGGAPPIAVQMLAHSYRGYAQLDNLLCSWLRSAGLTDAQVHDVALKHIRGVISQKFDARRVDAVFEEQGGREKVSWLDTMIQDAQWRKLIYDLSEADKSCVLLQYAIQRISDAGHQSEIASLTTASAFFTVFNRVLHEYLAKAATADADSLCTFLPDLAKMCGQSEHTYLYAQVVLHQLYERSGGASHLRRLSEELERAQSEASPIVRRLSLLLSDVHQYPGVHTALASVLNSGEANPGDVISLDTAYSTANPPPLRLLRHPEVISLLVRELFHPHKPAIEASVLSRYIHLLSFVSAAVDHRPSGELDQSAVGAAEAAVRAALLPCRSNPIGLELQAKMEELLGRMTHPLGAAAILTMVSANLLDRGYYVTPYATVSTPIYLSLLRVIAQRYPLLQGDVLHVLVGCFELHPELEPLAVLELRRHFLESMVFLMTCGCVQPVLTQVERWAPTVDPHLTRSFVQAVLDIADPPYSSAFLTLFIPLLPRVATVEAMRANSDTSDAVLAFLTHCSTAKYHISEPMHTTVTDLLSVLQAAPSADTK